MICPICNDTGLRTTRAHGTEYVGPCNCTLVPKVPVRLGWRTMASADIPAVLAVDPLLGEHELLASRKHAWSVACVFRSGQPNIVVGYAVRSIKTLALLGLYVDAPWRRRGFGSHYLQENLAVLRSVTIPEFDDDAYEFLVACGWHVTKLRPRWLGRHNGVQFEPPCQIQSGADYLRQQGR